MYMTIYIGTYCSSFFLPVFFLLFLLLAEHILLVYLPQFTKLGSVLVKALVAQV